MQIQPVYRERKSGKPVVGATDKAIVLKSSAPFSWKGLQIEVARTRGWHMDDLMVDGHLLSLNLASREISYRIRSETDWIQATSPPLAFWINPEGKPFSIEHNDESFYASIFIDGGFLDEVCGQHFELHAGNGVIDEVLARIAQAMIAILYEEPPHSAKLVEELIRMFVCRLAKRHGHAASQNFRGGVAPAQLKSLLAWLEDNLHSSLTVRAMAARVGLSAAHFSREFKRSTGSTPWEYVVRLRLEGARRLLEDGESVSEAALRYGFSDQSHLSRLFKLKYGAAPSSFVKTHRGWFATHGQAPAPLTKAMTTNRIETSKALLQSSSNW